MNGLRARKRYGSVGRGIIANFAGPDYCCKTGLRKFGLGAKARVCVASDIAGLKPGASTVAPLARRRRR